MAKKKYFVIDFDSTFIRTEGLEELAKIALAKNPGKLKILEKIRQLTNQGMEGTISFSKSLELRTRLLQADKNHVKRASKLLKTHISASIVTNKDFFKKHKNEIYIISGGFKELILPVVSGFGISGDHILANEFIYDSNGQITGIDTKNPLSKDQGKVSAVRSLSLDGEVVILGDGITDFQVKKEGAAQKFVYYAENVSRPAVHSRADSTVYNFDEFLSQTRIKKTLSFPKNKIKALLLENIDPSALNLFKAEGYQIEYLTKALSEEELTEKIKDIHILGIRSKTRVTKKVLEHASKLIAVNAFCIGTDQMDLPGLTNRGITVFNAPFQNTRSVVELAVGEIIMLMRGVFDKSTMLHKGIWDKSSKNSNEIRGKKLGIIGYGNIGSQLSVLAENLGMEVYFYDNVEKLSLGNAKKCASLPELLKLCDVITVHVSGERKNTNLISDKEFSKMKDGVILLNLSRGFVVDINALAKALKSGKVRGAALDVFSEEPKGKDEPFKSILKGMPNVILTPHIAGSTKEAQKNIGEFVSSKVIDFMNSGNTYLSVNIPNIQLPGQKKAHRLLHLHKNVPGILAQINNILANHKINILGQYLKTNEEVGYVITDVDKKYDQKILSELKTIPDTIRFRVLY